MSKPNDKKKILIVEDNPISGEDFRRRISDLGYETAGPITKGEEVLVSVSAEKPDLILMDIRLKGRMNGIEAAKEVNLNMDIPIIYITAHGDPDTIDRAKKTEPYGYIIKPFDDNELQSAIEIALYKYQSERQLKVSQQWFETTLNSIGDGVITTDMDGCISFINPVAEDLTGWSRKEAIGKSLQSVFNIINEISGETCENPVEKVIQTGQVVGLANHTLLISRDGRKIPIKDSGAPIRLNKTETLGVVLVFQNDTENRKAQNEILESNNQLKHAIKELRCAEQSLQENVSMLSETQKLSMIGTWEYDPKNDRIIWSEQSYANYGIDPFKKLTRLDLYEIIHPDYREYHKDQETLLFEHGEITFEYPIITPDGESRWIFATAKMFFNDEGLPARILGLTQNITERKLAEIEIIAAKDKLIDAQEFAKLGAWEFNINEDRVTWSDEHFKIYGISRDENPFPFSRLMELVHEDYHEYHNSQVERLLKYGSAEFEYPVKRPDGAFKWVWAKGSLKRDKNGTPTHMYGFTQDITERKEAENELRDSEERFRAIYEHAPVLIDAFDENGRCVLWNNECRKTFGWTIEEINEHGDALSLFYPDPTVRKEVTRTVTTDPDARFREWHPVTKDGKTLDTMWANFRLPDGLTFNLGYDITQQNISKRENRKLQDKLNQAQKMESIGNLAGGIAHDFNNILSSIIGFTELALKEAKQGSQQEDNLHEVYTAGKRAKELVWQILAFARETDDPTKPIQVDEILEEALKLIRSSIPTTIEIRSNISCNSLTMGNPTQAHQIIINLCSNAAHAMDESGGILEVSLMDVAIKKTSTMVKQGLKPGNYIELKVSDTGYGIPPEIIDSIFEPYFTTKDIGEGTGMGLAVVNGIVEKSGGKIIVESHLGKGTTFRVYLPMTKKSKLQRVCEPESTHSGAERILFIDDEAPIAKMSALILEGLGYSVTTRTSSIEGLELFRSNSNRFDLVITDMTMPNMTGDILAIELMKIRPDIPVILCTGFSNKISDESASDIGIKALAYKPIVRSDLAETVRKVLDESTDRTQK